MTTDLGPLDCLGAIEEGRDYEALVPLSVVIDLDGHPLRVLGLDTIVALKRRSNSPKDRLALPVLEWRTSTRSLHGGGRAEREPLQVPDHSESRV